MRILLTRLSALGDIVHTWPLADALMRALPRLELAWMVEEPLLPLVAGHPAVGLAIPVATRRWRRRPLAPATRREIGATHRALRAFAPDVALDPQGLVKSAVCGALARAPERVGLASSHRRERLAGVFYTRTVVPPPEARHVVDVNVSLATALGVAAPLGGVPDGRFLLGDRQAPRAGGRPMVALLPGTGGRGKAWAASDYAELARRLGNGGVATVVVWGPGERGLADAIAAAGGERAGAAPPTSIPELAALLARADVVVGGDTGPVHLAASLGAATVAIFLATDPARNGPRGANVTIVSGAGDGAARGSARSAPAAPVTVDAVHAAVTARLAHAAIAARPEHAETSAR